MSSLALDELIGNLKVHEVVMEKDSEIYRGKKERVKSIALKPKKESSYDEILISESDDEEYAMSVCLRTYLELDEWIKDSGCSKHMTGNKSLFSTYKVYDRGYPKNSKAYIVLNKHTMKVKESLNVTFDEIPPHTKLSPSVDDDVGEEEAIKKNTRVVNNNEEEDESIEVNEIVNIKESKNHPLDQVIGNLNKRTLRLCDDFAKIMHDEFEMSMMGEFNFFLGLQIKQIENGIFFNQSKYIKEMLKKFGLEDSKLTKTPMSTEIKLTKDVEADCVDSSNIETTHLEDVKRIFRYIIGTTHLGLWYPKGSRIKTIVYADSDHASDYVDRKSTTGVCTFMGCCLTSWFTKKQTALDISTTKAEYVSAEKACQQARWMKQALIDYDMRLDDNPIMCYHKGTIDLSKNPVQHSRTKHIEISHRFLCYNVQKGNISIEKVASKDNIADIFTKPLKHKVFNYLRLGLRMIELIMDSDSPSSQK
nr:copia protein [Tanacetum cinerariifolium]